MKKLNNGDWFKADKICIAMGNSVALNLMFESKNDHQQFFKLWDRYLGGMTEVLQYDLSPSGWKVMFRTKGQEEIKSEYHKWRSKSTKANKNYVYNDVTRILSEHFRIFLSQFVRRTNSRKGRKGTLVMERFKKIVFDSTVNVNKAFELLCKSTPNPQTLCKYRADEHHYDEKQEMIPDSKWKRANRVYAGLEDKVLDCMCLVTLRNSILRKILNMIKNNLNPSPPP